MRRFLIAGLMGVFTLGLSTANAQLTGTDLKAGDSCTAGQTGHVARNASPTQNAADITLICDGSEWVSAKPAGEIQDYTDPQYGGNALLGLKGNQTTTTTAIQFCLSEGYEAGVPLTSATAASATLAKHDGTGWSTVSNTSVLKTLRCFNAGGGAGGGSTAWAALTGVPAGFADGTDDVGDLSNLNASNLTSGTVPNARFPATLPAISGANLTNLDASDLATGTVATARLGSGTANSSVFLRGDGTWAAAPSGADNLGSGGTTAGTLYSQNGSGYGYLGSSSSNYIRFDDAAVGDEMYFRLAGAWEYYMNATAFRPYANNVNDLGSSSARWRDIWTYDTHTNRICNTSGGNCVAQSALGGGGGGLSSCRICVQCKAGFNNSEVCSSYSSGNTKRTATCPTNWETQGVSIQCQ